MRRMWLCVRYEESCRTESGVGPGVCKSSEKSSQRATPPTHETCQLLFSTAVPGKKSIFGSWCVNVMPTTRPTVVLLGTPKAGTSTLHACLAALGSTCCKWNKEPSFFLARQWHVHGSNTTFEALPTPNGWPPTGPSTPHRHVLDFTPSYLSRAWQSVRPLQQTYGDGRGLHLLVLLREPISRRLERSASTACSHPR